MTRNVRLVGNAFVDQRAVSVCFKHTYCLRVCSNVDAAVGCGPIEFVQRVDVSPPQGNELIASETVRVAQLEGSSLEMFAALVSGSTVETLGDGEAATLAFALTARTSAAIDERKATRIANSRFRSLRLVTTIDILAHHAVVSALGNDKFARAILQALRLARMQVRDHQFEWVANLIAEENLAACSSLRKLAAHRVRFQRESPNIWTLLRKCRHQNSRRRLRCQSPNPHPLFTRRMRSLPWERRTSSSSAGDPINN